MVSGQDWINFSLHRPNYFAGQYLLDEDFELAHRYLSDRQRYINSQLHLSGIVEGLDVDVAAGETEVTVQLGSAIDPEGNLIILPTATTCKINSTGWLCLRYHQQPKVFQQPEFVESFTRFEEVPLITLDALDSRDNKAITLAKITLDNGKVQVDTQARQYSGLRLPSHAREIALQSQAGALNIQGNLQVRGTLWIGDSRLRRISQEIDRTVDNTDIVPSEQAVNTLIAARLEEHLSNMKKMAKGNQSSMEATPDADGKLSGWQVETGKTADPSAVLQLVAYRAGEGTPRLSLERDTGALDIGGTLRAWSLQSSNVMENRMFPPNPKVYQDIFIAKEEGVIGVTPTGTPINYNDTTYVKELWNKRRIICYGEKDPNDRGAIINLPPGYTTVWVRVLGDRWYDIKADFIDGAKEDLGRWIGGYRLGNCYCPDGSLADTSYQYHQWLAIPTHRQEGGKLRLTDRIGSQGNGGLWLSGVAFSHNPWNHATQAARGYHWQANGGDAALWDSKSTHYHHDSYSYIGPKSQLELRVPYIWSGRDKLLYFVEFELFDPPQNGCAHTAIYVNGTLLKTRFQASYNNPFTRHWNSRPYNRYVAVRIPAELIPQPIAAKPPCLSIKIDLSLQDGSLHFREIGTHDLDVPIYP